MYRVSELFPGQGHTSRVWITDRARKDYEDVPSVVQEVFEATAAKGFFGRKLHDEREGFWGFSVGKRTERIVGYFHNPLTKADFIVGGAWRGKSGSGNGRPREAEPVMNRLRDMKQEGVLFPNAQGQVQKSPPPR